MKKSRLLEIIQEEIQNVLNEAEKETLNDKFLAALTRDGDVKLGGSGAKNVMRTPLSAEIKDAYNKMLSNEEYTQKIQDPETYGELNWKFGKLVDFPYFKVPSVMGVETNYLNTKEDFNNWMKNFKNEFGEAPIIKSKVSGNEYELEVTNPKFLEAKKQSMQSVGSFYDDLKYKGD